MSSVSNISANYGSAHFREPEAPRSTPTGRDTECGTSDGSRPIPVPGDNLVAAMTVNEKDSKTDQAFAYRLNAQINGQIAQACINEMNQGTQTVKAFPIGG